MAAKNAKARCAGTRRKAWQAQGHLGLRPPVAPCTTGFSSGGWLRPLKADLAAARKGMAGDVSTSTRRFQFFA